MPIKKTFFLCLLALGIIVGCGPQLPDGMPRLYPVTITVTQDGVPLEGANIVLSGVDYWVSTGSTDSQGIARLYTQGRYPGVPEGTHNVTVTKVGTEGEPPPPNPFDAESARIFQEYQQSGQTFRQFHVIPANYRDAATTPLTVEVTRGVRNVAVNVEGTVDEEIRRTGPRR